MKKFKILNKVTLQEGFEYLSKKEPQFKKILEEKDYKIAPFSKKDGFEGLISLIVEQQLSVASAKAIFGRVKKLVNPFNARNFLEVQPSKFKEVTTINGMVITLNKLIIAVKDIDKATSPFAKEVNMLEVTPPGAADIIITPIASSGEIDQIFTKIKAIIGSKRI